MIGRRRCERDPADQRLDLYRRGLRGVEWRAAHLERAYLFGAHLEGADLRDAILEGALLDGADLEGADLRGAKGLAARLLRAAQGVASARLPAELASQLARPEPTGEGGPEAGPGQD